MKRERMTLEEARRRFDYDPETGEITYRSPPRRGLGKTGRVGFVTPAGYLRIMVNGVPYMGHRLAWLLYYGEWPTGILDHIDRNPSNNAINNLRAATFAENIANAALRKTNTTGAKGVFKTDSKPHPWRAKIMVDRKNIYLGSYRTQREAAIAYAAAARVAFGEFAVVDLTQEAA